VDRQERVAHVVGTLEHVLHLERLEPAGDLIRLRLERSLHGKIYVGIGFEQLGQLAPFIHPLAQGVIGLEPPFSALTSVTV